LKFNTEKDGYDKTQVDAYIAYISETYKKMYASHGQFESQCAKLKSNNEKLLALCRKQAEEIDDMQNRPAVPDESLIGRTLVEAKKLAEQIIAQAKFEADAMITKAHEQTELAEFRKNMILKEVGVIWLRCKEMVDVLEGDGYR
jgi:cell division septum initiation protein DivIVA